MCGVCHQEKRAREQKAEADAVSSIVYGEFEGSKAGLFRWVFKRYILMGVWEWQAFVAPGWKRSLLASVAAKAGDAFQEDDEVRCTQRQ